MLSLARRAPLLPLDPGLSVRWAPPYQNSFCTMHSKQHEPFGSLSFKDRILGEPRRLAVNMGGGPILRVTHVWWVPLDPPMFAPCRRRPTAPLETQRRCRQRRRSFLSLSRASLWRPPLSYFGSRVVETRKKGAFLRRRQAHVGGACAWPIAPPMTELSSTGRGTGFDGSQSLVSPPFSISGSMQTPPPGICGRRRGTRGAGGARLDEFWLLPKARSSWTEKYRQGNEPSHGISRQPPGWIIHLVRS